MHTIEILNFLIAIYKYKRYLEIGVYQAGTFNAIVAPEKDGIDPIYDAKYKMTSDEFFKIPGHKPYDLIFVDGAHLHEQVLKDTNNALALLADNGTIVIHDCLPLKEEEQVRKTEWWGEIWNGDVWKAFAILRTRPDLETYVVDSFYGHGIVRKGQQKPISLPLELNWQYYQANRNTMLGVISLSEFFETEMKRSRTNV